MVRSKLFSRLKNHSGMSLAEVITAIGVSTIVGLGLMQSFRSVAVSNRSGQIDLQVQQFWQEMDFIMNTPAICSASLLGANTNPATGNAAAAANELPGNPVDIMRASNKGVGLGVTADNILARDPKRNGDAPYPFGSGNELNITSARITNILPLAGPYKKADLVVQLTKVGATYGLSKPTKTYTIYFADSGVNSNVLQYCSLDTSFANICQGLGGTIDAGGNCSLATDENVCRRLNGTWNAAGNPPCTFSVDGPQSCTQMGGIWGNPKPNECNFPVDINPLDPATTCFLWGGDWVAAPPPGACNWDQRGKSCANLGGVWNPWNATCYFPFQSAGACTAMGGTWTAPDGPCVFPSDEVTICEEVLKCTWNGTACVCSSPLPSPTPISCTPPQVPVYRMTCTGGLQYNSATPGCAGLPPLAYTCGGRTPCNCSCNTTAICGIPTVSVSPTPPVVTPPPSSCGWSCRYIYPCTTTGPLTSCTSARNGDVESAVYNCQQELEPSVVYWDITETNACTCNCVAATPTPTPTPPPPLPSPYTPCFAPSSWKWVGDPNVWGGMCAVQAIAFPGTCSGWAPMANYSGTCCAAKTVDCGDACTTTAYYYVPCTCACAGDPVDNSGVSTTSAE